MKKIILPLITVVVVFCAAAFLYGCEESSDKAQAPSVTDSGKADFEALVKETDRMLAGGEKRVKPAETKQETALTDSITLPANETGIEPDLESHKLNFYFPNRFEEDNYLDILGKDICDKKTVAQRREEFEGLVSCATWTARLKKAKTMLKMNISRYEDGGKAWEAINMMHATGGFIAGDVILTGDEEWPDTPEGQIEARSFIKSYYGRIGPTYVYGNELGKPEDYLLENDRQLEMLKAGK